jgi:hypothetical protein
MPSHEHFERRRIPRGHEAAHQLGIGQQSVPRRNDRPPQRVKQVQ